jgi:aminoglycoside 2'-N-acetyltransferase I
MRLREAATADLTASDLDAIRALMDAAFDGDFADEDMAHALGGRHWLLEDADDGALLAHASVVERVIEVGERPLHTGYVEAVGVVPARQRQGLGTRVMTPATAHIRDGFELGCLGTGEWEFYERLGWERWRGPSWVRLPDGTLERSADDDDGIMVLRTPMTPSLEGSERIVCEWRPGDSW